VTWAEPLKHSRSSHPFLPTIIRCKALPKIRSMYAQRSCTDSPSLMQPILISRAFNSHAVSTSGFSSKTIPILCEPFSSNCLPCAHIRHIAPTDGSIEASNHARNIVSEPFSATSHQCQLVSSSSASRYAGYPWLDSIAHPFVAPPWMTGHWWE